jgi:uncharacterized protein
VELTHQFTVPAAIDEAWATFNDLERIAPCFPGAQLTSFDGGAFEGVVKIKLGPISLQFTGKGRFVDRDENGHRAVIEASGRDKRGNGTAAATITATLEESSETSTKVVVATDLNVTGKPAQFGRGVMQDVSDKLLGQFASCLETKLGPAADAAPSGGGTDGVTAASQPASPRSSSDAVNGSKAAVSTSAVSDRPRLLPPPAAELDLGATAFPVLAKRLGPVVVAALVGLWLLRRRFRGT